jgi:hypothetical protein
LFNSLDYLFLLQNLFYIILNDNVYIRPQNYQLVDLLAGQRCDMVQIPNQLEHLWKPFVDLKKLPCFLFIEIFVNLQVMPRLRLTLRFYKDLLFFFLHFLLTRLQLDGLLFLTRAWNSHFYLFKKQILISSRIHLCYKLLFCGLLYKNDFVRLDKYLFSKISK